MKSQSIFQNISLTHKMLKLLHWRSRGGNVLMKIDMSKAYDMVDWRFLMFVLRTFGILEFFL